MQRIIVLAGNHKEYLAHIEAESKIPREKFLYGDLPESMYGVEAESVRQIGTFYLKDNAHKLNGVAISRLRYGNDLRGEKTT